MEKREKTPGEKIALVTGASRGIGRAIAEELAQEGITVAVNYQNHEKRAQDVVESIIKKGGKAKAFQADVSVLSQVQEMMKQIKSNLGAINILVNNAGITRDNLLLMMKENEWTEVLATHLNGLYNVTKIAAKEMLRQRWGRIINLSSVSSTKGGRGQSNYAAAKGGINGFTISLAAEMGSKGITVNAIAPGVIVTDMTERIRDLASEQVLKEITLGRFGKPQEIAFMAGFLASEKASYITGQIFYVDGGFRL